MPVNFLDFFNAGMARNIQDIEWVLPGLSLNIGAGHKQIEGATPLDLPEYNAETDKIPHEDNSVANIFCFHFLEHIDNIVFFLRECQRVLKPGGLMFICVPHYKSEMAFQDIDHKRFFTESTWKKLFENPFYDKDKLGWEFDVTFNMIVGENERNLSLLTQLRKKYEF
jgi:SAM-dependent methyltransferase